MLFSSPNEFWTLKWSLTEWGMFSLAAAWLGCRKCKFETPLSKKHGISPSSCLHPSTVVLSVFPSLHPLSMLWTGLLAQHSLHEAPTPMGTGKAGLCSLVMTTVCSNPCPGFCLGSVCYNFLQVSYKCIWGWCEYVLRRAEIGAAV